MPNYYYNGVELPALPEWDKEKYPYAYILDSVGYTFIALPVPYYECRYYLVMGDGSTTVERATHTLSNEKVAHVKASLGLYDEAWGELTERTDKVSYNSEFVWGNTDIYYCDATGGIMNWTYTPTNELFMKASDPVPVGGAEWQKHDAYKPNTKWDGQTFYKAIGNNWVKHDAYNPQGGTS